jgi:uncharacterized delta-60 repeat protein
MARLTPSGAPDTSFSGDGKQTIAFAQTSQGEDLALQPDGKIVVVGGTNNGTDLAIARLTAAGEPDGEFGADGNSDGRQTYPGWSYADAVAIQADGKIVVVGTGVNPAGGTNRDMVLTRLRPDGSPDTDFDGDGRRFIDFGADDNGFAIAVQPDGKIIAAGAAYNAGNTNGDIAVARVLPNGAPDPGFPNRQIDLTSSDLADSVVVQGDGRIAVAGVTTDDIAIARLNDDGSPDTSFDFDSTKTVDFGGGDDYAYDLLQQPNGKLLVAGDTALGENMAVARLQPGGALDTTFDTDGKQTVEFGASDGVDAMALEPNGAIVLAGYGSPAVDFAFARLEGEPPVPGGGGPGGSGGGGGPGGAIPRCGGKRATIVGTARSDVLRGTRRADVIVALGGNDRVLAAAGNDIVCGGAGNDRIAGDAGNDRLLGEAGRDALKGAAGNDMLDGGPLADNLAGGPGKDVIAGGSGKDRLAGGGGKDRLSGGGGRDSCVGGPGADRAACERKRGL